MTHTAIVSFIWNVANLIRDSFKRGKYQDVVLPLTVLSRLDRVLAPTKKRVLARQAELRELGREDMRRQLEKASGFAFYNTSLYDFNKLLTDAPQLAANLRNYIAGFSENMRQVIERFDFDNTISKLDEAGLLFQVLERFRALDLHPDVIDNPTMGTIFEELIRRFNEALDVNPGAGGPGSDLHRPENPDPGWGTVCLVSCQRGPEPVLLRWEGMEKEDEGDFFVRSGPGTVKLTPKSAETYVETRLT